MSGDLRSGLRVPGAADTARDIRCGTLDAVTHVASVLHAADASQSITKPWAHIDHPGALAAAERADAQRATGQTLGALHGVAVGVKDVIAVAGMPTRAGTQAFSGKSESVDAVSVARLRAAGAIIVGKTTTHELASGQGDPGTRNPRHPDHHPGGSSVGSAVAVAIGSIGATLATDTTGSIRNPAAVHGVVGFKPSNGVVSTGGMIHFSRRLDVIGPIGTSVADCRVLYEVLTGTAVRRITRPPVLIVSAPQPGATPAFRAVFDATIARLREAGAILIKHAPLAYDKGSTVALVLSLIDVVAEHRELLHLRAGRLIPQTRQLLASGCLLDSGDEDIAQRTQLRLRRDLAGLRVETGADAVIGLTLPGPQPLLAGAKTMLTAPVQEGSLSAGIQHLSMANVTGAPAITMPAGSADGHPVGVHLLGLGSDSRLLAVAEIVEGILCGREGDSGWPL